MRVAIFDQMVSAGGIRRFTLAMLQSWLKLTRPEEYHFTLFWPENDTAGVSLGFPFEIDPQHLTIIQLPKLAPGDGITWLSQHSHKFDLIYFPTTVGLLRSDQDLNLAAPCVVTLHDLAHEQTEAWGAMTSEARRENRQWAHSANGIIFSSDYIRDEATRLYRIDPDKSYRVYLAPPLVTEKRESAEKLAALRAKYRLPRQFLLSPGTAMVHKNPKVIIEAVGLLKASGICIPAVFIGPMATNLIPGERNPTVSHYHLSLQNLISQLNLELNRDIFILGHVPDAELPALYQAASAVVTASFSEAGLNGPVLEGMWHQTPVICSALPQFVERLGTDNSLALLFNPNDPTDLATTILHWLNDPAGSLTRVENAARFIRQRSWDDAARDYLHIFSQVAAKTKPKSPPITWAEGIFTFSGYSFLSRQTITGLHRQGVPVAAQPFAADERFVDQLTPSERAYWEKLIESKQPGGLYICFHPPVLWDGTDVFAFYRQQNPDQKGYVGLTMFETDRLPAGWAKACNGMDEVWVPTTFNRDTFARAGVDPAKLRVVPFGLDTTIYNPRAVQPLSVPGKKGFTFLSVFQWNKRKGWDVLLKAYLQAFTAADDVCLVIRAYPDRVKEPPIRQRIDEYVRQLGYNPANIPPIIWLDQFINEKDMPALYAAADAFVLPTRGEGWGIPFMEAMAMGLPTIATRWSAHLDFMSDDNSFLIDIDGLAAVDADQTFENPFYTPDQQWAEPSVAHTAAQMRYVFDHQAEARSVGARARAHITANWSPQRTVDWVMERVAELAGQENKQPAPAVTPAGFPVLWHAPIFDPSGYADEARNFIVQLRRQGQPIAARAAGRHSDKFRSQLGAPVRRELDAALQASVNNEFISLIHFPAYGFQRHPQARYNIGRAMFETDSLPPEWVEKCNQMDEVWVPTDFNLETFRRAGVTTKLVKVPGGIDTDHFKPGAAPLPIPGLRGTVFVSIFEWLYRKGWDVLLRAWAQAFVPTDDVCLVLRTYPVNATDISDGKAEIERRIDHFLQTELKINRAGVAPIIVLDEQIPEADLPRFYAAATAYVSSSRGEGWGRPQMQAMACGLPVIATRWGGSLEFMTADNSLLLNFDELVNIDERMEIPFYRGQKWAEPSPAHLVELLRAVFANPQQAQAVGRQARADMVANWQWPAIAGIAARRLAQIETELRQPPAAEPVSVVWEGSQFVTHSLALINREVAIRLGQDSQIELSLLPFEPHQFGPEADPRFAVIANHLNRPLSQPAQVHVRHQWPPSFTPPAAGHWVVIQPWEFGSLPKQWVQVFASQVDEMWVPSNYVRDSYIRSGIPAERVFTVHNGLNLDQFRPTAPPYPLKTRKKFKFLFVGGTILRKGIDILLEVYSRTYSADDDVCLVIKDMGGDSFYQGRNARQHIEQLQAQPGAPEIEYIGAILSDAELAGLYTACDCLVHPYRGEGFGLPIAEAMASGLPVIVTGHGAALDYCHPGNAYLIPAREVRLPEKRIGDWETVDWPWWAEPDAAALQLLMRRVLNNPTDAAAKAKVGMAEVRANFSWDKMAAAIKDRLLVLRNQPIRRHAATPAGAVETMQRLLQPGQAALEAGNLPAAAEAFRQVAEANPKFAAAFVAWGSTLQALGRLAEAAPVLRRAAELVPTLPDLPNQLGVIYVQLAEWEQAEAAFWQAHQLAPEDVNTLLNLIDLYRAAGNYDAASEMVNRALAIDPAHSDVLLAFGQICADLGDVDGVELAIERLHGQPGADALRQRLAGAASAPVGDGPQAAATPNNGHRQNPTAAGLESSAFDEQLTRVQAAGDWPAAIELLNAELARRQTDADLWNSLGVAYVMTGQLEAAEDALRQGLAVVPEHLPILHNLADIYLQLEAFDQATGYLNRALRIDPNDVPLLLSLGNCAIQLGGFDTALAAFERVRELAPDTAGIDEVLAQLAALQ
ncbi:MAG: D-inositol-3-phosphate glycosyltransferase [Anaerolineae bacterium]|nr:D-inositol-3-phosphate glycosyltransferase [Anaerolineae bacterium]